MQENTLTKERSRICGIRDLCVAEVITNEADGYVAGVPTRLAKILSATIKETFTKEFLYADDSVDGTLESLEKVEIEVELNRLTPADISLIYDTLYANGFLVKTSSDKAKEVAVGFRAKQCNGKYEFNWYYCGSFEMPERTYETIKDKKTAQTVTLKGTFYARRKEDIVNGNRCNLFGLTVDETQLLETHIEAKAAIASWFNEVQEYPGFETGAVAAYALDETMVVAADVEGETANVDGLVEEETATM